ncbi:TPA: hypothetical protein KKW95_002932 [Legionella pneumophila]|nr:hypothetical protein [Legionella pneumophila]HAW6255873.1 hypothetical protein [Legionella pneumophila]HBD7200259.1 hypothetical protein [Legionella pneumophila]HBD9373098.1 hypothetical protein [Legionella pneumophila]HEB4790355.1 hypothetical protein [Legionella pneumophila]
MSRFLSKNELGSKELWQYVKSNVSEHQTATGGLLLLDDSIEEKPYTT